MSKGVASEAKGIDVRHSSSPSLRFAPHLANRGKCREDLFRCNVCGFAQVVAVVVAEEDAVEEQCHYATELEGLRQGVAKVAEQEEEGRLELGVVVELGVLVDEAEGRRGERGRSEATS